MNVNNTRPSDTVKYGDGVGSTMSDLFIFILFLAVLYEILADFYKRGCFA